MSKKQQAKLKRQFSYLKRQFKEAGVDLSGMKFEDLEQKTFSSLSSMRARIIEKSGILPDNLKVISRKGRLFVKNENMKLSNLLDFKLLSDESYVESVIKEKRVDDVFYSYRKVYDEEGVRVDDYNSSAFYNLYNGIWENENNGYYLSYLVSMAKLHGDGSWYAEFLTYDLKITDYKFYTFDRINYAQEEKD